MRALCAGLNALQAALYGEINGLVIAQLEMQKRVVFNTAPIAPEQCIAADKVQRTGDIIAIALGHYQQYIVGIVSLIT